MFLCSLRLLKISYNMITEFPTYVEFFNHRFTIWNVKLLCIFTAINVKVWRSLGFKIFFFNVLTYFVKEFSFGNYIVEKNLPIFVQRTNPEAETFSNWRRKPPRQSKLTRQRRIETKPETKTLELTGLLSTKQVHYHQ